jgi:hypothetical protein
MRSGWRWILLGTCVAVVGGAASSSANACSGPAPRAPTGVPRNGASNVSTATSIVVLSQAQPTGLTLEAAGQPVPLAAPVNLGAGADGLVGPVSFWQIRAATADGMLPPSAEQVLTAQYQGGAVEVTRFTTAAGYDKVQGVAPVARALHLWRVRYPVSEINSGDCVFAEYHGFLTVDYEPGTVPNTPPGSVVHTFQLAPKTGGSAQTFSYVGDTPFTGLEPMGDHPLPLGAWQPELDPSREYCLGISAFGDGDIARLPLTSESVCANVVEISSAGAPSSGGSTGGGGCAVSGTTPPASAAGVLLFAVALARRRRVSRA